MRGWRDKIKRKNIDKCRKLRRNQTEAEKKLWSVLRNRQLAGGKFRRQFSVCNYILDFYSPEYKLGVEADGGQHFEDKGRKRDEVRAKKLSKLGVEILRFNDNEILGSINEVCEIIQKALSRKTDPLTSVLSPMGRGGQKGKRGCAHERPC